MRRHPQLATGCLWIDGDPSELGWRYCQKKIAGGPGRPWCRAHLPRVYRSAEEAKQNVSDWRKVQRARGLAIDAKWLVLMGVCNGQA